MWLVVFFRTSSLGQSGWRDSSPYNAYRKKLSPVRRVSSPTLYELESLSDQASLMCRKGPGDGENERLKRHSDIMESSESSQSDSDNEDDDDNDDNDDDGDDDLER